MKQLHFIFAAEEDYSIVIKILEFPPRNKYIDVNVPIINDESIEGNETFIIYLTSDVGVNVSPYVQTEVTIIDDDHGRSLSCICGTCGYYFFSKSLHRV